MLINYASHDASMKWAMEEKRVRLHVSFSIAQGTTSEVLIHENRRHRTMLYSMPGNRTGKHRGKYRDATIPQDPHGDSVWCFGCIPN